MHFKAENFEVKAKSNQLFEHELSSVPGAVALIQLLTWVTLANTPGKLGLAHPIP